MPDLTPTTTGAPVCTVSCPVCCNQHTRTLRSLTAAILGLRTSYGPEKQVRRQLLMILADAGWVSSREAIR